MGKIIGGSTGGNVFGAIEPGAFQDAIFERPATQEGKKRAVQKVWRANMANMAPWHDFGKFLAFLDVSARPAWERSLEGVLEETSSRQRAKKLAKVLKIIPRPSKTEPRSLQNRAWNLPRHHF